MDSPAPLNNPLSTFIHQLGTELTTRLNDGRRLAGNLISTLSTAAPRRRINLPLPLSLPFASIGQAKQINGVALSTDNVAKTLAGTSVYTVSNDNNEFVLISDPINGTKSIGLLCFRKEDAEAFLAQVFVHLLFVFRLLCCEIEFLELILEFQAQLRRKELRSQAKVVPISLDQVSNANYLILLLHFFDFFLNFVEVSHCFHCEVYICLN